MSDVFETFTRDVERRSFKDGVRMPLELMALGLCGEAAEVSDALEVWKLAEEGFDVETKRAARKNLVKELGDCLWYAQAMALHPDTGARDLTVLDDGIGAFWEYDELAILLMGKAGEIADCVKKSKWHGKPLDLDAVEASLNRMVAFLDEIGAACEASLEEVMQTNIDKLNARYPGGKFVEGGGIRGDAA